VSDDGGGIPDHIAPRIFTPFFTTKGVGKGTGQGLAISRNVIVKRHNGEITFETTPGEGTTFIVRIPLCGAETREAA
jgi:signal transduction histidine kinase